MAFESHQVSEESLKDQPSPADILKSFLKWVGNDALLVAHNATFDMRMLAQVMVKSSLSFAEGQQMFCTQK
jgi:DNA polymerase III epsilon subunit-like protein